MAKEQHLVRAVSVAGLAALSLIAPASPHADADTTSVCAEKPGRTVLQNGSGRVYLTAGAVYACLRGARKPYAVGSQWSPVVSSSGGGGLLRVALNGHRVAYSWEQNQPFGSDYAGFNVRYIGLRRDGFSRVYDGAGRAAAGQPADPQARDFVLCAGGQLAFIAGYRQTPPGPPAQYEVRVSKGRHTVLLDPGPGVQPGTLRATTRHIAWMSDGSARHAATTCERPMTSFAVPRMTIDELFGD